MSNGIRACVVYFKFRVLLNGVVFIVLLKANYQIKSLRWLVRIYNLRISQMFFCDNLMQILLYGIIFLIDYHDKTKKLNCHSQTEDTCNLFG